MGRRKHKLWKTLPMEMRPGVRFWHPAAAMDEEDLREEVRQLAVRGFGRIEAVVLGFRLPKIGQDEEWGTEKWKEMMGILSDEAGKQGMRLDITNGPEWPISSSEIKSADDKAALYELTYGELTVEGGFYEGKLPERRMQHEEGTVTLVHVMAYLQTSDHVLKKESYLDLMPYVSTDGKSICVELSKTEGTWKFFAFYGQPAVQRIKRGGNYVIDHISKAGIEACEAYWDKVLPQMSVESMEAFFCDSLEYDVTMEWSLDFEEEFMKRRGYSILPYLPVLGIPHTYPLCDIPGYRFEDKNISDMINRDYMEVLTQCYCENHLIPLEKMAQKYGKTVRYQVAYNRPFEIERCALHVGVPENEALGAASIDAQKNMAAAVHLGRKERYSFECAAEFGHSYGQNCEDLFWWIKRGFMAGMNAQVLHGASYSGKYIGETSVNNQFPGVKWPGYEAFGKLVSNYWNRTLSVEHAKGFLDTITRMNMIFRKKAKVDCAVLNGRYGSDGNRTEFCNYSDDGVLGNQGYSYEFVSEVLLELPVCKVQDQELDKEGSGYRCLIVDTACPLSTKLLKVIRKFANDGLPVIWIGEKPVYGKFYAEWDTEEKRCEWKNALDAAWNCKNTGWVKRKSDVPDKLKELGILPRIQVNSDVDVISAVREDEENGITYYILYRYNRAIYAPDESEHDEVSVSATFRKGTTKGTYQRPGSVSAEQMEITLPGKGKVICCNPWNGMEYEISTLENGENISLQVSMEEDEMLIFAMEAEKCTSVSSCTEKNSIDLQLIPEKAKIKFHTLKLYSFEPETPDETSFLRSGFSKEARIYKENLLFPWKELDSELEHFSGKGIYEGTIKIDCLKKDAQYVLQLGNICDTFTVMINGSYAGYPDQVMKRVDITGMLREGENNITVEVVSNLYNKLFREGVFEDSQELPYLPKAYGIWEEIGKEIKLFTNRI